MVMRLPDDDDDDEICYGNHFVLKSLRRCRIYFCHIRSGINRL